MASLIDVDKLISCLGELVESGMTGNKVKAVLKFAIQIAEAIPTVDAVPVVRCKDCKYMTEHYDTDGNVPYWTCSEWDAGTDYDGYCHYGERREDAGK